jgi:hypothetical protein
MMRIKAAITTASIFFLASTFNVYAKDKKQLSGLELQQIQAKDFESNYDVVFGSVMSVLQDEGYIISAADKSTGLITAQGQSKSGVNYNLLWGLGKKTSAVRVSSTVEKTSPIITRVRLNFVSTSSSSSGYGIGSSDDKMITEAKIYTNAFEKIEQSIFVKQAIQQPTQDQAGTKPAAQ